MYILEGKGSMRRYQNMRTKIHDQKVVFCQHFHIAFMATKYVHETEEHGCGVVRIVYPIVN